MIPRLRLYSGIVLLAYVTGHLVNHALGIISIEAMNAGLRIIDPPWRSVPGTVLLLGAVTMHTVLALYGLYRRRTLTMKPWEITQLIAGLLIPLLLISHIIGTRVLGEVYNVTGDYWTTMLVFWVFRPDLGFLQAITVIVVWSHACIGIHMWLRLKPWYETVRAWLFGGAVALPVLALAGYVSAGMDIRELAIIDGWVDAILSGYGRHPGMIDFVLNTKDQAQIGMLMTIAAVMVARIARTLIARKKHVSIPMHYSPGDNIVSITPGATALESLRAVGIEHASVCGGRGRCSTCRVRVEVGNDNLPAPDESEQRVLDRIGLKGPIRLACQIRPTADLSVVALLPPDTATTQGVQKRDHRQGDELTVAFLFVDLRGSTKLSEDRLPFDVVFILNQFFAELSLALEETEGHYAQFNGDGLMAIYGLDSDISTGSMQAINGAKAMFRRMEALNNRLESELSEPLKIGIGIHAGEAIVGSMGPPATPIVSGLGDNVNIAARLESQTKEFGVPLVLSARTAEYAGIDLSSLESQEIPVKGRDQPIRVYAISDPAGLARAET